MEVFFEILIIGIILHTVYMMRYRAAKGQFVEKQEGPDYYIINKP